MAVKRFNKKGYSRLLKPSPIWMATAIVVLFFACGDRGSSSMAPLESYIEAELFRLEETYRILDRYSEALWPGWKDYTKIPIQVDFPNNVVLLVTPPAGRRPGFERLEGRTILGKAVYINRRGQTKAEVRPPLFAQRGRGGVGIQLEMGQTDLPPQEAERSAALEALLKTQGQPDAPFDFAPRGDSDSHVLMYVHEHFHGHQTRIQPPGPGVEIERDAEVNAEYAAWSNIEGLALRRAYLEADDAAAREFLKDFVVAREIRRANMPPPAVAREVRISVTEGTASYVSLRTALLLKDSYEKKPDIDRAKDPFFYDFAYVDGYIDNIMRKGLEFAASSTRDNRGKYYFYGAYQCFLLDRFFPGWKRNFLEKSKDLDEAMAALFKLTPEEKTQVTQRLSSRYGYDEILSFHENVLKKRP